MSTNDGQCYSDRRDGEPIPPPGNGGDGWKQKVDNWEQRNRKGRL